jgi:hypothetical protein
MNLSGFPTRVASSHVDWRHICNRFYRQLGVLSYPAGEFRALTTDTNNYYGPSASADGKSIAATQHHFVYELTVSPASKPDELKPIPLMSHQQIWQWTG